jgi:hypothetical protein
MLIFCGDLLHGRHRLRHRLPPSPASLLALVAMPSVTRALSLFCVIEADISSIDAVVSSTEAPARWPPATATGPWR